MDIFEDILSHLQHSSQKDFYRDLYSINTVKTTFCDFCNILNSENIAGNIANEQYQRKLLDSSQEILN